MRMVGRAFQAILAVAALAAAGPALAQNVCDILRGQLAQAGGGNAGALAAQLAAAQGRLAGLEGQFRQNGCNVIFQVFAPPQCAGIRQAVSAARADVANLQQALARAGGGQPAGTRQQILAAMAANNCGAAPPAAGQGPTATATYRTVCVRPGDGFWFPIQYSTTRRDFEADAQKCLAACQGAELYFHRNPGEGMEQAVNVEGERYADLPYAFAFRTAYDPANACRLSPELLAALRQPAEATERTAMAAVAEPAPGIPLPVPRPAFAEDPDTLANRAGAYVPGVTPLPIGPALADDGGAPGDIRLVGPAYYYAR